MEQLELPRERTKFLTSCCRIPGSGSVGVSRSKLKTPVAQQIADLRRRWDQVNKKVCAGRRDQDLLKRLRSTDPATNPLNVFALLKVLEAVVDAPNSVLQLGDAVEIFVKSKAKCSRFVRNKTGYEDVPFYDATINNTNKRARIAAVIEKSINIIKLPVKYKDVGWRLSYIPNVAAASTDQCRNQDCISSPRDFLFVLKSRRANLVFLLLFFIHSFIIYLFIH